MTPTEYDPWEAITMPDQILPTNGHFPANDDQNFLPFFLMETLSVTVYSGQRIVDSGQGTVDSG